MFKIFVSLFFLLFVSVSQAALAAEETRAQAPELSIPATLGDFLDQVTKSLDLPSNVILPGLSDIQSDLQDVALAQAKSATPDNPSYSFKAQGRTVTLALLNSKAADRRALLINIPDISFENLVPGAEQTPLGAFGKFSSANFIYTPRNIDNFDLSKLTKISGISQLKTASGQTQLKSGVNLISEVEVDGFGAPIQQLFAVLNVPDTAVVPIRMALGPNGLANMARPAFGGNISSSLPNPSLPNPSLPKLSFSGPELEKLNATFGSDFIKNLKIISRLPDDLKFANLTVPSANFVIAGVGDAALKIAVDAPAFTFADLNGTDFGVSIDAEAGSYELSGKLAQDALKGLISFPSLSLGNADLAAVYADQSWDLRLQGAADLNGVSADYSVEVKREGGQLSYVATLDGGASGISAQDVAGGAKVPGLADLKLAKITVTDSDLVADLSFAGVSGEIAAFHPEGYQDAVLAMSLERLGFGDLVPLPNGAALDGVSLDKLTLMMVPAGKSLSPGDQSIPARISGNITQVLDDLSKSDPARGTMPFAAGVTMLAELDIKGAGGLETLMSAAGVGETVLPIAGTMSPDVFDVKAPGKVRLKGMDLSMALPKVALPGLPPSIKLGRPVFNISDVVPDRVATLDLPSLPKAGPYTMIGLDLAMQALGKTHQFDALMLVGVDAAGKRMVDLVGRAADATGFFSFEGLRAKTLDLAAVYADQSWDLRLQGAADLNGVSADYSVEVKREGGQLSYVATLDGGASGISAQDVAGGAKVPGLADLKLAKITVTDSDLVADLSFAGVSGEIAAFHPEGYQDAVLAMSLERLGFGDLVPLPNGAALDGVSLDKLTLMMVPAGKSLSPGDQSIPARISGNITQVLDDLSKSDPARGTMPFAAGVTMLAELDIKGAGGLETLMSAAGVGETVLPIAGTMSPDVFDVKAPGKVRLKGMDLSMALPKVALPGLPPSIKLGRPVFNISDVVPDRVATLDLPSLPKAGPYTMIGLDLAMQALGKTHQFDALMLVGVDAAGKRMVDLVGRAADATGFFSFEGLRAKTLDLAAVYADQSWDLRLQGAADLNGVSADYSVEVKREGGQLSYVATLDGGASGISAQDVAGGAKVPGLADLKLAKITVTDSDLVADLSFAGVSGEIAAFHPEGYQDAVLAMSLERLGFGDLVPLPNGAALDGVSLDKLTLMMVPAGKSLSPGDQSIPARISGNITQVLDDLSKSDPARGTMPFAAGVTMLAELDIKGAGGLETLMSAAGVGETVLPIAGTMSPDVFDVKAPGKVRLKGMDLSMALPKVALPGLPPSIKLGRPVFNISDVVPDRVATLDLPSLPKAGPYTMIGLDLAMQALGKTHQFDALMLVGVDAAGKRMVDLVGRAADATGFFSFEGLRAKTLDLAAVYADQSWDLRLQGAADLNGVSADYSVEVKREGGQLSYVATLDGGASGISAQDVAGGAKVPGLADLKLAKITVTDSDLVADLSFAGVSGEIAAFHPEGYQDAVLAMSLERLGFGDLVPLPNGAALDGVSLDKLTLMMVPAGKSLSPGDQSIPARISGNITQVLDDLSKSDPARGTMPFAAGVTMLAELDIKGAGGLETLMSAAGVGETVLPIAGTMSPDVFDVKAPGKVRLKGMDLSMALPKVALPGLPPSIKLGRPVFNISDVVPDRVATLDLPSLPKAGPYTMIGLDLAMQALGKTHQFDALMLVGVDAAGKRMVDLVGRAADATGFFSFEGLRAKTLDLAAVYADQSWDLRLQGAADLNGVSADYSVEVKREGGQLSYVATLDGGASGISAQDVAGGAKVPGLADLKLAKITVTDSDLVADLSFAGVSGEIAAFHPEGYQDAVLAMSLERLGFGDLVPLPNGAALDGVSLDKLTLMMVPTKGAPFGLTDKSLPGKIRDEITAILSDASSLQGFSFKGGVNLFAELDLQASPDMNDLMSFIGKGKTTKIPIFGVMSNNLFDKTAKPELRFAGMDLAIPMPNIALPDLPNAFAFRAPQFKIADVSPSGVAGLWTGISAGLNGDLLGQAIDFTSEIGFSDTAISLNAASEMQMPAPFGISWLGLKDLALKLNYDRKLKTGDFQFNGITADPFGKVNPKVAIKLSEVDGKLASAVLKIDETIAFTDIPILAKVPHADQFSFDFFEISTDGIAGGSTLHGLAVDVAVFMVDKGWVFAVADHGGKDGFKFSRVMPALKDSPLADFHLDDTALVFSQAALSGAVSKMPLLIQPMLTRVYGAPDALVKINEGITIAANFSPGSTGGNAAKGLGGIGISETILLEGSLQNIFGGGGVPSVGILAQIQQGPGAGGASHVPQMVKFPKDVGFFINFIPDNFEVGLQNGVVLSLPKGQSLDLISKLELGITEKGFDVAIMLDLVGEWRNPLGVPGIALEEVALKFGVDDIGNVIFGFAGQSAIADVEIDLAAEADFLVEASGLPDGIAIKGELESLDFAKLVKLAEAMADAGKSINIPSTIPLPEIKDLEFAFATPGTTDPDLGLTNPGVLVKGDIYLAGQELGSTVTSVGATGLYMKDKIADIKLDGLQLKDNSVTLDIGYTKPPEFKIDTNFDLFGVSQKAEVTFEEGIFEIDLKQKLVGLYDSDLLLAFGFDGHHGGVPSIFVEGQINEGLDSWVEQQLPDKIKQFFSILDQGYKEAVARINKAEDRVRGLDRQIESRKEQIQREKARADRALESAQQKVNSLRGNMSNDCRNASNNWHNCRRLRHITGSCRNAISDGWRCNVQDKAAVAIADAVLEAAKQVEDHLPTDLDPELVGLRASRETAMGALEAAKLAISGLSEMDQWMKTGLDELTTKATASASHKMTNITFAGNLGDQMRGGPFVLSIDLVLLGKDLGRQTFAFKMDDPKFDALQLSYIPLHLIHEIFKNDVPRGLSKLMGPVLSAIVEEISEVEKQAQESIKKANAQFNENIDKLREDMSSDVKTDS